GVNFVTTGIPKDARISLSVTNVPVGEVIQTIGEALGGSFKKTGNTFVFQKGQNPFTFEMRDGTLPMLKNFQGLPKAIEMAPMKAMDGKNFEWKMLDGDGIHVFSQDPKNKKEWEQMQKDFMKQF